MADKKLVFETEVEVHVDLINDSCDVTVDLQVEVLAQGVLEVADDSDEDLHDHYRRGTLTFEVLKATLAQDLTVEALGHYTTLISADTEVTDAVESDESDDIDGIFEHAIEVLEQQTQG
ncbi:MAG: hypothetical protein GY772_23305 [bacterium]|nr:hypothetical protein [bacterium]